MDKGEGITARRLTDWATRFRGGERARRWRRAVGNGGRLRWLGAARGEGEREKWSSERVQQALALFWSADARRGDLGSA